MSSCTCTGEKLLKSQDLAQAPSDHTSAHTCCAHAPQPRTPRAPGVWQGKQQHRNPSRKNQTQHRNFWKLEVTGTRQRGTSLSKTSPVGTPPHPPARAPPPTLAVVVALAQAQRHRDEVPVRRRRRRWVHNCEAGPTDFVCWRCQEAQD